MKKRTRNVLLIVVVAVVGVLFAVWLTLGLIAKKGVEIGGTAVLGLKTQVDWVGIKFISPGVSLRGFQIANPEGYKTDRAIALGYGRVRCDLGSLLKDEVVVREIRLEKPELTIEMKGLTTSNIGEILDRLSSKEPPKEPPKEEPKGSVAQKKFKVEHLVIAGAKARFHLAGGKTVDVPIPTIDIKDIKNADGTGLMLGDLMGKIIGSMAKSAAASVGDFAKDLPADVVKGFGTTLGSAGRFVTDGVQAVGSSVGKGVKGIINKLK